MTAAVATAPSVAADPEGPVLLRSDADGVATLTLNRPQARNALSMALMGALQDAARRDPRGSCGARRDPAGRGPAFCAGHDLKEMRADPSRAATEAVFRPAPG